MSKITERACNIASAVYPPSDERHLLVKDLVENAQDGAARDAIAALDFDRLVEVLAERMNRGYSTDPALEAVWRSAYREYVTPGRVARDPGIPFRAALYALIVAALGLDNPTTTRPQAAPTEEAPDV